MKSRIKATLEKIQTEYSPSVYAGAKPAYGTMIEKGLREIEDTFF